MSGFLSRAGPVSGKECREALQPKEGGVGERDVIRTTMNLVDKGKEWAREEVKAWIGRQLGEGKAF